MATASFRAFKTLYPDVSIRVFAGNDMIATVMRHCPFIDKVEVVSQHSQVPPTAVDWGVANGIEGTTFYGFWALGIEDFAGPRKMSFEIDEERRPQGMVAGIQLHGGWPSKQYRHWKELGHALQSLGFEVRCFGQQEKLRSEAALEGFQVIDTPGLENFARELNKLAVWIGFDSGGSYLANALGVPSVWLWATHDPAGLIGGCGDAGSWEAIWRGKPVKCFEMHGISCRFPVSSVGQCPFRGDKPGADCIDEIEVNEILDATIRVMAKERGLV
jgi:hypothetical protein